jgi:hypothetical protein
MLADGYTYIWYQATDSFDDRATRNAMALLSSAERDNCSRFAFERDRRDYAAAHGLLRSALSDTWMPLRTTGYSLRALVESLAAEHWPQPAVVQPIGHRQSGRVDEW